MNVLHISRRFFPFRGGTEEHIKQIGTLGVSLGIISRVLTLDYDFQNKKQRADRFEIIEGIEVYRIPAVGSYKKPIPLRIPLWLFRWADIVHLHDIRLLFESTILLRTILRFKVVLSTHGLFWHTEDLAILKRVLTPLYIRPLVHRFVDTVIADSEQDAEHVESWQIRNLCLIPNGIHLARFTLIRHNPRKGELLYFGRIDFNKGLENCLDAVAAMPSKEWHLNIVGSGDKDLLARLQSKARLLGVSDRISWHGTVSDEDLDQLLSTSQLVLFPSRYEGFGYTLVEAMAAGCVCVAQKNESYRSFISNKISGFLVDFLNPEETARTINDLSNLPSENLVSVSAAARMKASEYSDIKSVATIHEEYVRLLGTKSVSINAV